MYNLKVLRVKKNESCAKSDVYQEFLASERTELTKAVKFCQDNNCRGNKALSPGLFPGIQDFRTMNRRLDGEFNDGNNKAYCQILTPDEELQLVEYIKNRNTALQPMNRSDITSEINNKYPLFT